jgi:ferric-dicitrate binding protein FerR (iron transport regulator)
MARARPGRTVLHEAGSSAGHAEARTMIDRTMQQVGRDRNAGRRADAVRDRRRSSDRAGRAVGRLAGPAAVALAAMMLVIAIPGMAGVPSSGAAPAPLPAPAPMASQL